MKKTQRERIYKLIIVVLSVCVALAIMNLVCTINQYEDMLRNKIASYESQINIYEARIAEYEDIIQNQNNQIIELTILKNKLLDINMIRNEEEWFIAYKKFVEEYPEECKFLNIYEHYSEEDIEYMQRCVETEVHGADFESKTNVARVIINRVNAEKFPNNATEVITSPNQFAYHRTNISEDTILAIEYAFLQDVVDGALWFHSNSKTSTFSGAGYLFTDKAGHHFYR